jgi:FkbM family methyltransferase
MSHQQTPTGTFSSSLIGLFEKNVRYSTVIDVGCADGHFFAGHKAGGIFPGAVPFNVDANAIYEESLKAIKDVAGGAYFIGAVTDHDGEIEMTDAAHPYWNSVVPDDDPYWKKINHRSGKKIKVPAATLDSLVERFRLKPPYLLKLDVQGGEPGVIRGGANVLKETQAVICEVDLDDFQSINAMLLDNGFNLFDITQMNWLGDRSLGWFYPVYVNRKLAGLKQKTMWAEKDTPAVLQAQVQRRKDILQHNASLIPLLRNTR